MSALSSSPGSTESSRQAWSASSGMNSMKRTWNPVCRAKRANGMASSSVKPRIATALTLIGRIDGWAATASRPRSTCGSASRRVISKKRSRCRGRRRGAHARTSSRPPRYPCATIDTDPTKEAAMATRNGSAEWRGDLQSGAGTLTVGDGVFSGDYSFASRFEDGEGTNPEELIAAAHAACFSMALSSDLAGHGHPVESVRTTARVHLRQVEGAPTIQRIDLETEGRIEG